MRIIVHAGMNKTGSSAVQEFLRSVRGEMPGHGYLYPGENDPSHWKLAVALTGEQSGRAGKAGGYLDRRAQKHQVDRGDVKEMVAAAIKSAGDDDTVILSHENFSTPPRAAALNRFLKDVAPGAEIHAIAYVRHPASAYPSVVQQVIKGRFPVIPPSRWTWSHPKRAAGLRAAFGAGTVIRIHDRTVLRDGDVVEDFRSLVADLTGRPMPAAPKALSTNASISAAGCALLYRFWKAHPESGGEQGRLRRELERFSAGRRDPRLRLPEGWDKAIAAQNHRGWNEAVELLSHDEAVKQGLRIAEPVGEIPRVGLPKVEAWLGTYLDRDVLPEFAAHLEARGERAALSAETLAWVQQQVRA